MESERDRLTINRGDQNRGLDKLATSEVFKLKLEQGDNAAETRDKKLQKQMTDKGGCRSSKNEPKADRVSGKERNMRDLGGSKARPESGLLNDENREEEWAKDVFTKARRKRKSVVKRGVKWDPRMMRWALLLQAQDKKRWNLKWSPLKGSELKRPSPIQHKLGNEFNKSNDMVSSKIKGKGLGRELKGSEIISEDEYPNQEIDDGQSLVKNSPKGTKQEIG